MSYDVEKESQVTCPKCRSLRVKADKKGVYYCGDCGWERGLKPVKAKAKIGRNDPCICGSRKKWKRCCMVTHIYPTEEA